MEKYADYISKIEIPQLWTGHKHIVWKLAPDVNVLSGVNGIGKSTILHRIVSGVKSVSAEDDEIHIDVVPEDATLVRFDLISTPDVRSEYDINLNSLLERYDGYEHDPEKQTILFDLIDRLFCATGKAVLRDKKGFLMQQYSMPLQTHLLSSGEKQMLCILLTVYMEGGKPTVLFMDEPEVSLHMEWQQQLIATILKLNPKVQLILTTHSPAIIMHGWMDKVTEVTDITVED